MPFATVCPNCAARLTAPDTVRGKKVKCKKCDEPFVARRAADPDDDDDDRPAKPAAKARPRPGRDDDEADAPARNPAKARRPADDEDDERPARRRRDQDDEEDGPRPKAKKKRKSKQKKGPPVLLFVLLGVGALVLIGGGIGAYFAFIKEEKPADMVANGDGPKGPAARGGGTVAAGGPAAEWVEQHDADGRYRIKFPSAPRTQNVTQQTPAGPVTLKVYLAGGQTEAFVCTHQQLPADRAGVSDDQILDQAIVAAKVQAQGAIAGPTRSMTYQSLPGREVAMTFPGKKGEMIIRVILAGDRVLALSALGDNATPEAPRVKQFFESLKIE
jgi:hypothetical protein